MLYHYFENRFWQAT